jgi:hypothetical protein
MTDPTGREPREESSKDTPKSTWAARARSFLDCTLGFVEQLSVLALGGAMMVAVLRMTIWKYPVPLEFTLRLLEKNWRGVTLISAVLFYRPIRKFLEELESFAGARRRIPEVEKHKRRRKK